MAWWWRRFPLTPAEVRAAREKLGFTTRELADALECTLRTVQMWEAGDRNVPGPARVALRLLMGLPQRKLAQILAA